MDKVKRIQELRRSNAATAIPSKKKYSRKEKYKKRFEQLKNRARPLTSQCQGDTPITACDFNLLKMGQ